MADAGSLLHKGGGPARLWRRLPGGDRHLCKKRSTFSWMTTGTVSGILKSIHAVRAASGWTREGRDHESTVADLVTVESRRGATLCRLRHSAPGCPQDEPEVVVGIPGAGDYEHGDGPLPGLPPASNGAAHRSCHQRPHLKDLGAARTRRKPTSKTKIVEDRYRGRRASCLACPASRVGSHGRRDDP